LTCHDIASADEDQIFENTDEPLVQAHSQKRDPMLGKAKLMEIRVMVMLIQPMAAPRKQNIESVDQHTSSRLGHEQFVEACRFRTKSVKTENNQLSFRMKEFTMIEECRQRAD
jgi:hypothetical protein